MKKEEKTALIAIPIIILFGIGLAIAGSQGGAAFAGFLVFAVGKAGWSKAGSGLADRG